jgi:hypothetical protein
MRVTSVCTVERTLLMNVPFISQTPVNIKILAPKTGALQTGAIFFSPKKSFNGK